MLDPMELLAPIATLFAVIIAIFAFMFPRALELYKERLSAISEIDVPDYIRERFGFKIGALGDALLLFSTSVLLLGLGTIYCPALLYRIANFYLGSTDFGASQILSDFREFVLAFGIFSALALVAVVTLFINDVFFSEKRLPALVKIYLRNILGQRVRKAETKKLLPESKRLLKMGAYGEAILNSIASLEIALKSRFDLPLHLSFGRVIIDLKEELGKIVSLEELNNIRKIRNMAAHPTPERRVTKEDAETVLNVVDSIMRRLELDIENV
jgi:HEPN domain-containing protein